MATLVKIRGLDRGDSAVASGTVLSVGDRGFRVASGYGLQYLSGVKATASNGATNGILRITAKYGGTWANGHAVTVSLGGSGTGTVTLALAAGTGVPTYTVTGGAAMTAAQAAAALNADPSFSVLYTADNSTGTGASVATAGTITLASGTNVGTGQPIYVPVNNKRTAIVDIDDAATARTLRRNYNRVISLGAA